MNMWERAGVTQTLRDLQIFDTGLAVVNRGIRKYSQQDGEKTIQREKDRQKDWGKKPMNLLLLTWLR